MAVGAERHALRDLCPHPRGARQHQLANSAFFLGGVQMVEIAALGSIGERHPAVSAGQRAFVRQQRTDQVPPALHLLRDLRNLVPLVPRVLCSLVDRRVLAWHRDTIPESLFGTGWGMAGSYRIERHFTALEAAASREDEPMR